MGSREKAPSFCRNVFTSSVPGLYCCGACVSSPALCWRTVLWIPPPCHFRSCCGCLSGCGGMPFRVMLHSSNCCPFWKPCSTTVGGFLLCQLCAYWAYFGGFGQREDLSLIHELRREQNSFKSQGVLGLVLSEQENQRLKLGPFPVL